MDTLNKFKSITIYANALCNLKCSYCYINKGESLKEIDKSIEKSITSGEYLDLIRKVFTDKETPENLDIWGGEVLMTIDRCIPLYTSLLKEYKNLNSFLISTNFSYDYAVDNVYKIFEVYKLFPNREFLFKLQISLDGDADISDITRGKGVSKQVIKNFNRFIKEVKYKKPENVKLQIGIKPTMSRDFFYKFLDYEYVKKYFIFFENNFVNKVIELDNKDITINNPIFNVVLPYDYTQEDGKIFAKLCENTNILEKDNKNNPIFKYYKKFTPFKKGRPDKNKDSIRLCGGICGSGVYHAGVLPNKMLCCCHRAFMGIIEDYYKEVNMSKNDMLAEKMFKISNTKTVFPINKLSSYQQIMNSFYDFKSPHLISNIVLLIQALSLSGQIDEKYKDIKMAVNAARFIVSHFGVCIYDNECQTGSFSSIYTGIIKLLLNGAKEQICDEK